jgi:sec-independent protein translocase protein TatA
VQYRAVHELVGAGYSRARDEYPGMPVTPAPVAFGGIPGGPEMLLILLVAVLLFGANKIPRIARSLWKAGGEFKRGRSEIEDKLAEQERTPEAERRYNLAGEPDTQTGESTHGDTNPGGEVTNDE